MEKLLILGAGQYGFVAKEVAEAMGIFSQIDFLDDCSEIAVGKLNDIEKMKYDVAFVAIGNPEVREQWIERISKISKNGKLATLIHPKAVVSPSAVIADGCIIEGGAVISTDVKIGKGTIVMASAIVGHNATVGSCCQLKYNCTIPENYVVSNQTKVDCNVVYRDSAIIEKLNKQFMESEIRKKGAEPSFF